VELFFLDFLSRKKAGTNSPTLGTRPNKVEIKIKYSYSFLDGRQNNKNLESIPIAIAIET